jgi:predicted lipid-binding transport protein (Tim44 family)
MGQLLTQMRHLLPLAGLISFRFGQCINVLLLASSSVWQPREVRASSPLQTSWVLQSPSQRPEFQVASIRRTKSASSAAQTTITAAGATRDVTLPAQKPAAAVGESSEPTLWLQS